MAMAAGGRRQVREGAPTYPDVNQKTGGFTLIELSIVLVIIGLIVGGVLAGSSMIRAAQVNRVATQIQEYETVARMFQDQYMALPGDMRNASSYWSGVGDGNGNGQIEYYTNEMFLVWKHLALASLIKGNYTGSAATGSPSDSVIGSNIPQSSSFTNGGFSLFYWSVPAGNVCWFPVNGAHMLGFGKQAFPDWAYQAILIPGEVYNLDKKFDDGKPGTGRIRAIKSACLDGCVAGTDAATASYNISNTSKACSFVYHLDSW